MALRVISVKKRVSKDGTREVHVKFDDGKIVKIGVFESSWALWNAPSEYRWKTVPIAEKCNSWLHGRGEFPKL